MAEANGLHAPADNAASELAPPFKDEVLTESMIEEGAIALDMDLPFPENEIGE